MNGGKRGMHTHVRQMPLSGARYQWHGTMRRYALYKASIPEAKLRIHAT